MTSQTIPAAIKVLHFHTFNLSLLQPSATDVTTSSLRYRRSPNFCQPLSIMSQREAYVAPTASGFNAGTLGSIDQTGVATQYLCGDCNVKNLLKKGDPIRCKDCGHRVLYKERTKRYVPKAPRKVARLWGMRK